MKNFKIIFLIVFSLFVIIHTHAQTIGIKGGFNLSKMKIKSEPFDFLFNDIKSIPGFHFGTFADFRISDQFFIESDLLLTTKGFRHYIDFKPFDYVIDDKLRMLYLDIPLMAKYKYDLGKVKLYGMAGPYLGIGIIGYYESKTITDSYTDHNEDFIKWGDEPYSDNFSRIDYGLAFGLGVEFKRLVLGANYFYGMKDIHNYFFIDDYEVYNRVFNISLGFMFGKKGNQ